MKIYVDIDEESLREFDQAARAHSITRSTAVREAITAWLSQTRRDAVILEMFDVEVGPVSPDVGQSSSEKSCEFPLL